MNNPFTKISPPKYRVGRFVLNEYEVRCLMAEVCLGIKPAGYKIKDQKGVVAEILPDGRPTKNLHGFDICSNYTLTIIKERRKNER